ncbi:hypothetical protein [Mesorhizobium sp. 131-3-5]|uniref:hypothetical protein n=1 Tax=Mesorhizobium sp. 131-3-5 TaxID=2744520 RepID=UPI001FD1F522|nr:hypothetical protein [Mesorhizobium sp. 131-3-5]
MWWAKAFALSKSELTIAFTFPDGCFRIESTIHSRAIVLAPIKPQVTVSAILFPSLLVSRDAQARVAARLTICLTMTVFVN